MQVRIVKEKISKKELERILKKNYGEMVKVDVDVKKEILAIGGEWHSEGEELLNAQEGSRREDVWGVNFYPGRSPKQRIEYVALINIKPSRNLQMEIEDIRIREKIQAIIEMLLLKNNETLQ